MKWIKSYNKLFEDIEDEEDDIIPDGFKYSWNDVNEALLYLTDLGFQIDKPDGYGWDYREEAKKRYLAGYKAEFRELKPEDIVGLKEDWEIKKAKEYIGTKAIIVKFDYNKVFNNIKKEILKNK